MLNKVEATEFNNAIQGGICCDANYLTITATNAALKPVFYIYTVDEEVKIGFALYEKGNKIVIPMQLLFYSGICFKGKLRDDEFNIHFYEAIGLLKKLYPSITLVTSPEIKDLRPFLWNNFEVKLRYTYCKETKDNYYSEGIVRDYKRAIKKFGIYHTICLFDELEWGGYNNLFKMLNYSSSKIIHIKNWLTELDNCKFLCCLELKNNDNKSVGSGIVLLNKQLKKGYFIYMDINKKQHRSETNAYIYIEVQKWLFENGYNDLDYIGANTNTIAKYKSRYVPKLEPYYVVTYNKYSFNLVAFFKKILNSIRKTLLK